MTPRHRAFFVSGFDRLWLQPRTSTVPTGSIWRQRLVWPNGGHFDMLPGPKAILALLIV
jgi:hypothetical protein